MLRSEYGTEESKQLRKAQRRAKEEGVHWCVVSVEDGGEFGERTLLAMPLDYVDSDEYAAFDGRLLHVVSQDGSIE